VVTGRGDDGSRSVDLADLLDLTDVEAAALERLDPMTLGYYAGGAGEERTLRSNRAAWAELDLWHRALVDVSTRSTATSLLGLDLPAPVLVAPTALHRLAHPDGELATARACSDAGVPMVVSSLASTLLEDVVEATSAPVLLQLYVGRHREVAEALVERAERAGCVGIQLTVDTPVWGERHREHRTGFHLPDGVDVVNLRRHSPDVGAPTTGGIGEILGWTVSPTITWDDLSWLCGSTRLPVLTKGVCRPDDARRALDAGAAGVVVSNHGGRQLDGAQASLRALPAVVQAVAGRVPVLLDGGIRRGSDVFKALALGATAVLVGRPQLWGLAVAGQDGVARVLELLDDELDRTMGLAGVAQASGIAAAGLVVPASGRERGPAVSTSPGAGARCA
jgi:4-hydroxymandelate oxidase